MYSLFDRRIGLPEQNQSMVIERGRGVEFHLQGVEFDDDDIARLFAGLFSYKPPPFLSPDGKAIFTALSCSSRAGRMGPTERYFIARHSLTDGQGSYFHIAEFDDIDSLNYMEFYALSDDRLGALVIGRRRRILQ